MSQKKITRRDALKAAVATGAVLGAAPAKAIPGERMVVSGVGRDHISILRGSSGTMQAPEIPGGIRDEMMEQLVEVGANRTQVRYSLVRDAMNVLEQRAQERYEARWGLFQRRSNDIFDYHGGVLRTCFVCGEDDFFENVPVRDFPFHNPVCGDCWPRIGELLPGVIEL